MKADFLKVWRKDEKHHTILELFDNLIADVSKTDIEQKSIQRYETAKAHLEKFIKKNYHKTDMEIYELDHRFGFGFYDYCMLFTENNTAVRYLGYLKASLNFAVRSLLIDKNPLENVAVKRETRPINKTMVTEAEQLILYRYRPIGTSRYDVYQKS